MNRKLCEALGMAMMETGFYLGIGMYGYVDLLEDPVRINGKWYLRLRHKKTKKLLDGELRKNDRRSGRKR